MFVKLADDSRVLRPPVFSSSYGPGDVFLTNKEASERYVLKDARIANGPSALSIVLTCEMPNGATATGVLGGRFDEEFAEILKEKLLKLVGRKVAEAGAIELENPQIVNGRQPSGFWPCRESVDEQ